ncbi:putative poly(A)-specific ribonuclease [Helianthus annuus]|nr:putative poly(A)-specific ribonuclease [Helianthus annuus]
MWALRVARATPQLRLVFGITMDHKPSLDGHVVPNPVDPESYMVMFCYKNGSLTREDIRDRCTDKSWDVFNQYEASSNIERFVRILLERAYATSKLWDNAPVVLCGDFNSTPKSSLYNFISEQKLNMSELPRDKISGQYSAEIYPKRPVFSNFRDQLEW